MSRKDQLVAAVASLIEQTDAARIAFHKAQYAEKRIRAEMALVGYRDGSSIEALTEEDENRHRISVATAVAHQTWNSIENALLAACRELRILHNASKPSSE